MWKIVKKGLFFQIIVLAVLLIMQTVFFAIIYIKPIILKSADLIVVFEGRPNRSREAYDLINHQYASTLVVSPATKQKLRNYDRMYMPKTNFNKIVERKASTTFENALYTGKIIKENNFKSVILVTSWDHMPRSYLLLKLMLAVSNTNARINTYQVPTGKLNYKNWYQHSLGWKMICNEMIETWGSLVEFLNYEISGELFSKIHQKSNLIKKLKLLFIFETKPDALETINETDIMPTKHLNKSYKE